MERYNNKKIIFKYEKVIMDYSFNNEFTMLLNSYINQ